MTYAQDRIDLNIAIEYLGEEPGWSSPDFTDEDAWQPLPESPSPEQLRESLVNTRAGITEGLKTVGGLVDGLQKQINALDRMLKEHRHAMGGDRGWTGKSEF